MPHVHNIGSPKANESVETIDHPDADGNDVYYIEVSRDPADTDRFAGIQNVYGKIFEKLGDVPNPANAAGQSAIQAIISGRPANGCRAGTASQTAGVWTYKFSDSDSIPSSLPIPNKAAGGGPNIKADNFLQVWVRFAGEGAYTAAANGPLKFRALPPTP
jgi:hypothetical protein